MAEGHRAEDGEMGANIKLVYLLINRIAKVENGSMSEVRQQQEMC